PGIRADDVRAGDWALYDIGSVPAVPCPVLCGIGAGHPVEDDVRRPRTECELYLSGRAVWLFRRGSRELRGLPNGGWRQVHVRSSGSADGPALRHRGSVLVPGDVPLLAKAARLEPLHRRREPGHQRAPITQRGAVLSPADDWRRRHPQRKLAEELYELPVNGAEHGRLWPHL